MLLDVWEWFLLISDGIDLVLSNLASGTYPIPFSFLLVVIFFGLISFLAWKSTDIPDLPPTPRPPYVIQLVAGPAPTGSTRQTISDVRLLSGGFFDGHELLTRYRNFARNQATNTTDQNSQQPQPGTSAAGSEGGAEVRRPVNVTNQNIARAIPGRSFLLSLFRRPDGIVRRPTGLTGALRAQLTSSPNVVVYHRVNVYHHHIHSHPVNNSGNSSNNPAQNNSQNQDQLGETISPQSSSETATLPPTDQQIPVPTAVSSSSSLATEASSTSETSPNQTAGNEAFSANLTNNQVNNDAFFDDSPSSEDIDPDRILNISVSPSTVQFVENSSQNLDPAAVSASPSTVHVNMPADNSLRDEGDGNISQQKSSNPTSNATGGGAGGGDDVRFTIKFLNDTQMDVTSQLGEKIVDFKRRHFSTEMAENKTVRLIFNGRVLDNDNKTLREFGIFDHCVVHCLIVNRQQNQDQSRSGSNTSATGRGTNRADNDPSQGNIRRGFPEPGMFFLAFIGIFLIFLWFICLHFGQHLFTQSAVVSLTVLTAIFLIGIVACYLPLPVN